MLASNKYPKKTPEIQDFENLIRIPEKITKLIKSKSLESKSYPVKLKSNPNEIPS
jgi:hypothetical protein